MATRSAPPVHQDVARGSADRDAPAARGSSGAGSAVRSALAATRRVGDDDLDAETFVFSRSELLASDFSPERFITQYARAGALDDVKRDLHRLQRLLSARAVEAVSRDFPDFVDLTVKLSGLSHDTALVHAPVVEQRAAISTVHDQLTDAINTLETALAARNHNKTRKSQLKLLLRIHSSVDKLDALVAELNASRHHRETSNVTDVMLSPTGTSASRGTTNIVSRVVSEYAQLTYLRGNLDLKSPFVDKLQPRIDAVRDVLAKSLVDSLSSSLSGVYAALCFRNENSIASGEGLDDQTRSSCVELVQSLRVVVAINQLDELLTSFVTELQHNTFLIHEENIRLLTGESTSTARHNNGDSVVVQPQRRGVADLTQFYNSVLRFLERCDPIFNIVESVTGRKGRDSLVLKSFEHFVDALSTYSPGIFNSARTDAFHQNYTLSKKFIDDFQIIYSKKPLTESDIDRLYSTYLARSFSELVPEGSGVKKMDKTTAMDSLRIQDSSAYTLFMGKWPFSTYFQLRFKQIADHIDNVLSSVLLFDIEKAPKIITIVDLTQIRFEQTCTVLSALEYSWKPTVYLNELAHKFWELTLRVLSRYTHWITFALQNKDGLLLNEANNEAISNSLDTADKSLTSTVSTLDLYIYSDIKLVQKSAKTKLFAIVLNSIKPAYGPRLSEEDTNALMESLNDVLCAMNDILPAIGDKICDMLTSKCLEPLKIYMPKIPSIYRMTNKEPPTTFSQFIPFVIDPLKNFVNEGTELSSKSGDKSGSHERPLISKTVRLEWAKKVIDSVLDTYVTLLNDIILNVSKFEAYNTKKKTRRHQATNSVDQSQESLDSRSMSDDSKIRLQLYLDVVEMGKFLCEIILDNKGVELKDKRLQHILESESIKQMEVEIPTYSKLRNAVQEFSKLLT